MDFYISTKCDGDNVIAFTICSSIAVIIILPIMAYWFYKTYKYRNQSFIRSRHPKLLFFNCTLAMLSIIERLIALQTDLCVIIEYDKFLTHLLYILIFGCFMRSYLLRHWLLFYDLGYREAQANLRWEHELNLVQSHWFIDHRSNFGNVRFMQCLIFSLYSLDFILIAISHSFDMRVDIYWGIFLGLYAVIFSMVFLVISHKISEISKTTKMKKELLYAGILILCGATGYVILYFISDDEVLAIIEWSIGTIIPFIMHLMSTWYQIRSNTKRQIRINHQNLLGDHRMHRLPKKMLDLRQVISNESGFKLFIRHLIKLCSLCCCFFVYTALLCIQRLVCGEFDLFIVHYPIQINVFVLGRQRNEIEMESQDFDGRG